jgi:hypothetical protein
MSSSTFVCTSTEEKWKVSTEIWPWKDFPHFFPGASVLIPGRKIKSLRAAIQTTPFFKFDDVYWTGLCSARAKLDLTISETYD